MQKLTPKKKQQETIEEELVQAPIIMMPSEEPKITMRTIGLVGDVDEEKAGELIYGMLTLREFGKIQEDPENKSKNKKQLYEPFDFYLSTNGGSAPDMFAIYDVMRQVRKDCDIHTIGLGKVMSAGVLLLAAGTKGKRKIGKHCRVMIHSVLAGNEGPLHNLENEMNEIRWTQERYIKALIEETKMTQGTINKLLQKHVNIYLSAEEAVKYGIADEVI
jgi:ATP-dependent Clp endopeptidase proteolytic subunit ClpP